MKTLIAIATLSIAFLSAGAFAGDGHTPATPVPAEAENVTVVIKNQSWPYPGRISVDPCKANRCIDI